MAWVMAALAIAVAAAPAHAADAVDAASAVSGVPPASEQPETAALLSVSAGGRQQVFTLKTLLNDARRVRVTVDDANFKRTMQFEAIAVRDLFAGLPVSRDDTVVATASDGYVSHLPMRLLLADDPVGTRAYLAIENPAAPWPALDHHDIGPFRLIWTRGRGAAVPESRWTYGIVRLEATPSAAQRFPAIRPARGLPVDDPVMRGFDVFQTACLSCHTLNGQGDAHLGPDLNVPFNPVEYLGDARLRLLIRDPQALRWWPNARMPAITPDNVSDAELNDLIAYLHHMAHRKAPPPASNGK